MQRDFVLLILTALLFSSACAESHGLPQPATDGGTLPDETRADAQPAPSDTDGALPVCAAGGIAVRGLVADETIDERRDGYMIWRSIRPGELGGAFATSGEADVAFVLRPLALGDDDDDWRAASVLAHVGGGRLFCGVESTQMRATERTLGARIEAVRDLGACADAPPVAGTVTGCGPRERCSVVSTIPGHEFAVRADSTSRGHGGGNHRLTIDLEDDRGNIWVWTEESAVELGVIYLPSRDGTDFHVYCVGDARLDDEQWTLSDLRDLGTCGDAPAATGSLEMCVQTSEP